MKPGNGKFEKARIDETSIGNILVDLGFITQEDLDRAIEIQRRQAPIGEILTQMRRDDGSPVLQREQLDIALMKQKIARGEAGHREELSFYRSHTRQMISEFSEQIRSAAEVTTTLAQKLTSTHLKVKVR